MKDYRNRTKEKLLRGEMAFGFQIRFIRDLEIIRMLSAEAADFVFIDLQRTPLDVSQVSRLAIASLEAGITPIARLPEGDFASACRLIDGGVQGIVVPGVETADQARRAVESCKYRPVGTQYRGDASIHFGWSKPEGRPLTEALNEILMLVVMIESGQGVENVDEIAAVPGVDVLSIGSSDLSGDMGINGDFAHPRMIAAWEKVAAAAARNRLGLRIGGVKKPEDIRRTYALGSRMIIAGNDIATLSSGIRAALDKVRDGATGA